jgi:hypothetical protein
LLERGHSKACASRLQAEDEQERLVDGAQLGRVKPSLVIDRAVGDTSTVLRPTNSS